MKALYISLATMILCVAASTTARADIINMNVSASMQIINSSGLDVGQSVSGSSVASVNLTQLVTGMNVFSDMRLSVLNPESAIFDFTIGMHGNDYFVNGLPNYYPYLGTLGYSNPTANGNLYNGMFFNYRVLVPTTATVTWSLALTGSDTFGMNPVNFYNPVTLTPLAGGAPGSFSGSATYLLTTNMNPYFEVTFDPNVSGGAVPGPFGIGVTDGQYNGRMTFDFQPVEAVSTPEPAALELLITGLTAFGFLKRRLLIGTRHRTVSRQPLL